MSADAGVEQPGFKRRRVTIACTTCRARKTRCDGNRPKCDACVQMGHNCSFIQPHANNEAQGDELRSSSEVMKRLEKIEAAMKATSESEMAGFKQTEPHALSREEVEAMENQTPSGDYPMPPTPAFTSISQLSSKRDYTRYKEGNTDGLAAVPASSDDEEELDDGEGPYYGPSSNITLIKQISSALFRTQPVREWHHLQILSDPRSRSRKSALDDSEPSRELNNTQSQVVDPYELPQLPEAQAYISHFFTQVALFLSCLHQKSFLETFRRHRANLLHGRPSGVSKVWLGSLNLVFAISRTTMEGNTPDANKLAACEIFYQRAMKLAWGRCLRGQSVEIVQFLHLKSAFLQGTERSLEVWATHILAINTAYSIGLHTTQSNSALSPLEREIRTRTWYCLLIDDHTLSAAWGRPSLTAGVGIQDITSFKEDTGFYAANVPKPVTTMTSAYLSGTVSLGFICQATIHELYDHNLNSTTSRGLYETTARTNEICWKLHNWRNSLPVQLQPPIESEDLSWEAGPELYIIRLRGFLSLRYHNQYIIAYRAVLSKFLDDSYLQEAYEPLRRTGLDLLHDCVTSCVIIIDNVQTVIMASEQQIILNGAWWLLSYYLFNASLVLCGIVIAAPKKAGDSQTKSATLLQDSKAAFSRGVEVMNRLGRGSAVVSRCCGVLNRFAELLDLSGVYEDKITTPVPGDGSTAFDQNPSYSNIFNPYIDRARSSTAVNSDFISSVTNEGQPTGEGTIYPGDQEFSRDANSGFGIDGLEYLLEIMSSGNNALDFV